MCGSLLAAWEADPRFFAAASFFVVRLQLYRSRCGCKEAEQYCERQVNQIIVGKSVIHWGAGAGGRTTKAASALTRRRMLDVRVVEGAETAYAAAPACNPTQKAWHCRCCAASQEP